MYLICGSVGASAIFLLIRRRIFFFFLTHLPIVGEVLHRDPPRVRDVIEYIPEEKHRAAAYL